MSDNDAWDADDYEPPAPGKAAVAATDKWEGEDEDDDVKDAWDADSDDESSKQEDKPASATAAAATNKKKAKLRSKIALKEAAEAQADEDLTPEEKASEKLRAMKMEENAQMSLTRDMLGLKGVDSMIPVTKEEFTDFSKALCEKIRLFNNSEHYNDLLESITKDLVIDMSVPTLKKVKIHVEGMHSTRLKEEKSKTKKTPAAKGKTSLKNDLDKDLFGGGRGGMDDFAGDDMDDFM